MKYKLICFDLDGTLVDDTIFIWQTIHEYFGTDMNERKNMAKKYFRKKITYSEWAGWEVRTWVKKGANKEKLLDAISRLKAMEGAQETLKELKKQGFIITIVSGSLNFVVDKIFPENREIFSDILINKLMFDKDGNITGSEFTDYDFERKAEGLKHLAEKHNIPLSECIFVGDHNNDLEIAGEAGLSIAFNSKSQRLNAIADHVVEKKDLREILNVIGNQKGRHQTP